MTTANEQISNSAKMRIRRIKLFLVFGFNDNLKVTFLLFFRQWQDEPPVVNCTFLNDFMWQIKENI